MSRFDMHVPEVIPVLPSLTGIEVDIRTLLNQLEELYKDMKGIGERLYNDS